MISRPLGKRSRGLVVGVLAVFVAGCATAGMTPTPNRPTPAPSASASSLEPVGSASLAAATPSFAEVASSSIATPSDIPEPDDTPCLPVLPKGAPAAASTTAPAAPDGTWSGIHWQKLPANALPDEYVICGALMDANIYVFGWSKGYVALEVAGDVSSAVPYASSDGLTWHRGKPISFGSMWDDESVSGPDNFYLVEGPAGLAIVGTEDGSDCGWAPPMLDVIFTSSDGLNWHTVNLKAIRGGYTGDGPYEGGNYVAGGGAGYLVTGSDIAGVNRAWTSSDLVTWHAVALNSVGLKGNLIQDAAVFSGGFVMTGYAWTSGACSSESSFEKPAAWWSADGTKWSQVSLPGSSLGTNVEMTVIRVTDRLLLAEARVSTGGKLTGSEDWITNDGVTWSQIPIPRIDPTYAVGDGVRGFVIKCPGNTLPACAKTRPSILQLDGNLGVTTVTQTGFTLPNFDQYLWPRGNPEVGIGNLAVGPTGFLCIDDNGTVWFGAPTAALTSTATPSAP